MIKYRAMKLDSNFQGALLIKWLIHSKVRTRMKILAIGLQVLYVSTILGSSNYCGHYVLNSIYNLSVKQAA